MFTYKPLFKLLIDRDMKKGDLKEALGLGRATIAKMGNNEYVAMRVLDDICQYFNCSISDVIEFVPETKTKKERPTIIDVSNLKYVAESNGDYMKDLKGSNK